MTFYNSKIQINKLNHIITYNYNKIILNLENFEKKQKFINIIIKLPKIKLPNKNWICKDSWDCDYPEKCCDYKIFKMCCMEGVPIRVWDPYNPQYSYIYIKNKNYDENYNENYDINYNIN
jgi:hypothetical protein